LSRGLDPYEVVPSLSLAIFVVAEMHNLSEIRGSLH